MKDYESYRNNGNKDIPDNTKLKKIEFCNMQFQDNILPGEYFDIRENALECDLNDDDKFAANPGENGSANTKSVDDIQDLTNAVNQVTPTATGSIVESAGAIATGTATAVVGASAAVVAFNAVTKTTPKMEVNKLEAGSTYVYYDLNFSNLELDKNYDIVIQNTYHSFRIECSNGQQDGYVYDLRPGLQYTLSLVGPSELFTEITYDTETFYTLKSSDIFVKSSAEVIYEEDLTCSVNFESIVHDDFDKYENTYVLVSLGDEILFDSFKIDDYDTDDILYDYNKDRKTHRGTIKNLKSGTVSIQTYIIDEETGEKGNLDIITKKVVNPISYKLGENFIRVLGNSDVIKEVKEIDNDLYVKVYLYDIDDKVTTIEAKLDSLSEEFNYRTLVRQDTKSFNYEIGYYNDGEFITINKLAKTAFNGGTYNATYKAVISEDENLINVKWLYDDDGYETADITLLTNFKNNGNDDMYYRAELLRMDYSGEQGPGDQYILLDTYEGTGNAVFKNVELGEIDPEEGFFDYYRFLFRYTSLMNYYYDGVENDVVEVEVKKGVASEDGLVVLEPILYPSTDEGIEILSNGKLYLPFYREESGEESQIRIDDANVKLNFYFYQGDYNVITDIYTATNIESVSFGPERSLFVFNLECPEYGTVGYYYNWEIPYYERYGGNLRIIKTDEQNYKDLYYDATPVEIKQVMDGSDIYFKMKFVSYTPSDCTIKAIDGNNIEYLPVLGDDGYYYFEGTFADGSYLVFHLYNAEDIMIRNYIIDNYALDGNKYQYMELFTMKDFLTEEFGVGKVVYTYNDDGTININILSGFENPDPDTYNIYLDYWLEKQDYELGGWVTAGEALGCKDKVVNFNSTAENPYDYLDTFRIKYRVHVETIKAPYGEASVYYESSIFECLDFTGSNMSSLSHDNDLKPQRYDGELYLMQLVATNDFNYPKDQTVTFSADGVDSMSFVLSELEPEVTGDGTIYMFQLSSELYNQPMIDFVIKANYTLTEEKLSELGNNYVGNLYNEFTYQILGA